MENSAPTGTIIGYDPLTGEVLFTETNRVLTNPDQTFTLPRAGDNYQTTDDKNYFILGIRDTSTLERWEMDVWEEMPAQEPDRTAEEAKARKVHTIVDLNFWLERVKHQIASCIERLKSTTDELERARLSSLRAKLELRRDALTNEIKSVAGR
jgi:hypothetical protein